MNEIREQFPLLWQLFGGYFHQDWMVVHRDEDAAIRTFVFDGDAEEAYRSVTQLDNFLALGLTEQELEHAMHVDLSCEYDPEPDGRTMTYWLRWVRDTLAKYAAEKAGQENPVSSVKRD